MLTNSRPRYLTLGLLGVMMALLIAGLMYTQGTASAQQETGATVKSLDVAPLIECKWELPDMIRADNLASGYMPDPLNEYDTAVGVGRHDDDTLLFPTVTPACSGPEDGVSLPSQPDGVRDMVSVKPYAHIPGDPVPERPVQLWMSVDHAAGLASIGDVYWDVYHPDGTLKIQVHGTKIGVNDAAKAADHNNDEWFGTQGLTDPVEVLSIECAKLGQHDTPGSMFEAAYHSGQVSAAAIDEKTVGLGMVARCQQNEKAIYYSSFDINKDQPCGDYRIEAYAVSTTGKKSPALTNYIDVICFSYMNIDFNGLDWGVITPGQMQVIGGNLAWDGGAVATPNSNPPTVHNGGNHPMGIHISFSSLDQVEGTKFIDKFDACFGKSASTIACLGRSATLIDGIPDDAILADEVVGFGDPTDVDNPSIANRWTWKGRYDQVLCANEFGKLDLSIHPRIGLEEGTYVGKFFINYHTAHDPFISTTASECYQDQVDHPTAAAE